MVGHEFFVFFFGDVVAQDRADSVGMQVSEREAQIRRGDVIRLERQLIRLCRVKDAERRDVGKAMQGAFGKNAFARHAKINFSWRPAAVHHDHRKRERDKRDEEITMDQDAEQGERQRSPAGPKPPMRVPIAVLVFERGPRDEGIS